MRLRFCPHCRLIHASGKCEVASKQADIRRGSNTERGYDGAWRMVRLHHIKRFPLCADCIDVRQYTAASEVHHMHKVSEYPERRLDPDNLMSLCRAHHRIRTARGE